MSIFKLILVIILVLSVILLGVLIYDFVKYKIEKYIQPEPKIEQLTKVMSDFFDRHKDEWDEPIKSLIANRNIMNEIEIYKGVKSYTINKQDVFLCLTEEDGDYYPDNTLIFVLAHELAHVICDETGHTEKFHFIFGQLLEKLEQDELFDPNIEIKRDYCEWSKE